MRLTDKPLPLRRPRSVDDSPRGRVLTNLQAQTHRLIVALDELKAEGSVSALDAALHALHAATTLIDGLPREEDG